MDLERSSSEPPGVVTRTRNPVRRVFHWAISLLGWVFFGYFWYVVFARPLDRRALPTFGLILLVLGGIVLVNALWVQLNRNIYRTRGRRTKVREVSFAATADQLGRPLIGADWERLRQQPWIRIEFDPEAGVKSYRAVAPPSPFPKGGAGA